MIVLAVLVLVVVMTTATLGLAAVLGGTQAPMPAYAPPRRHAEPESERAAA